jgi:hypothetical protein
MDRRARKEGRVLPESGARLGMTPVCAAMFRQTRGGLWLLTLPKALNLNKSLNRQF